MKTQSRYAPLPVGQLHRPFDDPDWIFEVKYDGFRAIAHVADGKAELFPRNPGAHPTWQALRAGLARDFGHHELVLDGELACLDADGCPVFMDLLWQRREPVFIAFDLLHLDGEDLRDWPLVERKERLRKVLLSSSTSVLYAQYVVERGRSLFDQVLVLDLEGIVAKLADAPYRRTRPPHWIKIENPRYPQANGPRRLFES